MVSLKNKFYKLAFPLFACIVFLSCQKDLDYVIPDHQLPDFVTKVTSSVSGFVTDENNLAVLGADVVAGGVHATTDKYGYFEINNVQVVKNAAIVTVSNPGYFKGIKTYIATENKAAFFRIKLIPKTTAGTINAASGGNVSLSNGMIVALPANAVVNASSNAAYTGTINVAAHWIDPTAADLTETMPGDLRGVNTNGSLQLLTTYGMAAVELTGSGGELLQIASGKKATLTMTIPASIMAEAPATIPLWSFDETNGLWKQEGQATKTGNTYVGEVSHFSFWNCDVPNNYVQFNCTVKDQAGNPIVNAWVRISVVGSNAAGYGITDATGYVAGAIPDNAQLLLEVFTNTNCGTPVYSQNFTTTNVNVSLGIITIPGATNVANVSGTVTDCNNNPVTNGRIVIQEGYYYSVHPVSNTGTFNFSKLICNSNASVNIIAEDLTSSQQSSPLTTTLVGGANVLGNLQACGVSTQQFITYSIDGGPAITISSPGDSLTHSGNGTTGMSIIMGSNNLPTTPPTNSYVSFGFDNTGIAVGSIQALASFYASQLGTQTTVNNSAGVTITEYGIVGQFISGNFTATLNNNTTPPTTSTVVCSFRVRRNF